MEAPEPTEITTPHTSEPAAPPDPQPAPAPHPEHRPARPGQVALRLLLVAVFIGGILLMGAVPRMKQHKKLAAMAVTRESTLLPVGVVRPHSAPGTSSVTLPGNIQAVEETTVGARTSGYLKRRYVDIGAHVRAGQVLADIEAPELDQQLIRARAETAKSKAGHEQAEADVVKLSANVAQYQSELARQRSNVETARADLAHSQAKLLQAEGAKSEAVAKLSQVTTRLNGQRATLARFRTRASLAEKTFKRWQELERGGAVSGQELDEKEADYDAANANVLAAQADVESAQADIEAARHAVESRTADISAAQADVGAATQKIQAAESSVSAAQSTVDAMQASVKAGRANARAAVATIAASQATVKSYSSLIGFEQVRAPFNGVITARNVDTGALITAGGGSSASDPTTTVPRSGLFGIARTDVLRVQVQLPQPLVHLAKSGLKARILVQEYPGRSFEGVIWQTSGALDAASRTLLAEIRVNNPGGLLMPGMYAQVQFLTSQAHPSVLIPANTLIVDGSGARVATVDHDRRVRYRRVKIGRDYGKEMEITEGLVGNELLITNPSDELSEGLAVRAKSEAH